MNTKRNRTLFLLVLIVALPLAACGGPSEGPASATPLPTTIVAVPTAIVTPVEEATEAIPVVTEEAAATATKPAATATKAATAAPTTAVPAATEPPRPESVVRRIEFATGATSAVVSGRVGAGQRDVYLFRALAGQGSSLGLASPGNSANFTLSGLDDGLFHKGASDQARQWSGTLPLTQDYIVVVTAPDLTDYTLQLAITPLPATGSIRGLVFQDTNRDNSPSDDEPVEGAPVQLRSGTDCNTLVAETTTTEVGGAYAFFELKAGTYCVRAITPEVTVGVLVELGAGENAVDVNLSWPGSAQTGSIRGLVFEDTNRDNSPSDDEPVEGAPVYLLVGAECSTLLAETATTEVGGAYAFFDLPGGTYCVRAVTPEVTVGVVVELGPGEDAVDVNLMWPGTADG